MRHGARLKDRVAIVTGAARGIGRAIATRFADEGARVCLADKRAELVRETAAALAEDHPDAAFAQTVDIADRDAVQAMVAATLARWGRLDIMVNNAALPEPMTPFADQTWEHYKEIQSVNLDGAYLCTLAALPHLEQSPCARILNIASIMGVRGSRDSLPYSTAKGGLVNMTRCLAADLAPKGVRVNAIAPGFIDTPMARLPDGSHEFKTDWFEDIYVKYGRILLGNYGQPEDIAGPAFFLCSDDAGYVTGQILLVDGGVSSTF
jgi:NAD(P)-dependent dehydrogenase (short-subunit alcohol dehydrogenase family)